MPDLAEELHKPVRRKFKKRRILVNDIDRIGAADLVDMEVFSNFNRGVKYLLVFSKYGWLLPLRQNGKICRFSVKDHL